MLCSSFRSSGFGLDCVICNFNGFDLGMLVKPHSLDLPTYVACSFVILELKIHVSPYKSC